MSIAGVDGCRAGWIMVKYHEDKYEAKIYTHFKDLISSNPELSRIFIDIPIGLSTEKIRRTIDSTLRSMLKRRGSTVFNAPSRTAVYEQDNKKARAANIRIEGKSLSIQSLNIRNKIKEVDEFLLKNPSFWNIIYESHPEFCFSKLKGDILSSSKSTPHGIIDRLNILASHEALIPLYHKVLDCTRRIHVKKDDIVDAMCLCLCNKIAITKGLSLLEDENKRDEEQIPIRIAYPQL